MDADRPYRPGEPAPHTGYYWVVRYGEMLPSFSIRLVARETFPNRVGWLYWFAEPELLAVDGTDD